MVCAMTADAIRAGIPTCIRSYRVAANQGPECTIVEAARATTAVPGMFKPKVIDEHGVKMSYVGGGLGCNNPTAQLLAEAEWAFPNQPVACVISVGNGQLHSAHVPDPKRYHPLLPSKLLPVVEAIATDCERTNQELSVRFIHTKGVYFRFNIDQGMQDIGQWDAARLAEVQAHTRMYLQDILVNTRLDDSMRAIIACRRMVMLLSECSSSSIFGCIRS